MLAVVLCLLLLWALIQWPEECISDYLLAWLAYVPVVHLAEYFWGLDSRLYTVIYCLFTALILAMAVRIGIKSLTSAKHPAKAATIAGILVICLTRMAFVVLGASVAWFDWIVLPEGGVLLWAGMVTVFDSRAIFRELATFWLLQAVFDFGWALHWPAWDRANRYSIPALMGIVFFAWLGARLRRDALPVAQKPHNQPSCKAPRYG